MIGCRHWSNIGTRLAGDLKISDWESILEQDWHTRLAGDLRISDWQSTLEQYWHKVSKKPQNLIGSRHYNNIGTRLTGDLKISDWQSTLKQYWHKVRR